MVGRVGLVGCGRIARRHIDAIDKVPGLSLAVVSDILVEKAREVADPRKIPWTTSAAGFGDVDVVVVASPSGLHSVHVREALESTSARFVVCEKPLALSETDAKALYDVASRSGKTILPVYQLRYNPLVQILRNLIREGALGKIYQVVINVLWNRNDEYFRTDWHGTAAMDGGVLFTQASHYLDALLYLLGGVERWEGFCGRLRGLETPDTVSASMRFDCDTVASLNATVSAYRRNVATEAIFIAERGSIRVSGPNLSRVDHWDVKDVPAPEGDALSPASFDAGHLRMYQYVAANELEKFPAAPEVLSGLRIMESLSRR